MASKSRLVKITKEDKEQIIKASELIINLTRELKAKYEKKNVYLSEEFVLPLIKESLVLYLATKKKLNILD
jgi:hypothetical protein